MRNLQFSLLDLANSLGTELKGAGHQNIKRLATLQNATPDSLSFLANPSYRKYLDTTRAGAVILSPEVAEDYEGNALIHQTPYLIFARATHLFDPVGKPPVGIHPTASVSSKATVHPTASVGPGVTVEANAVVGENSYLASGAYIGADVQIGSDTIVKSNVNVCHSTVIGNHCIIHEGAVIGSDGFGFAHDGTQWIRITQLGKAILGNHVEVGANTTIDRGALEDTIIEDHVILDNQIQIAHNVRIGKGTAIAANAGIAGSTSIGANCSIGGGAGICGHITIADGVVIAAMAMITKSIKEPETSWSPGVMRSTGVSVWRKNTGRVQQLDSLFRRVKFIEKYLDKMKKKNT